MPQVKNPPISHGRKLTIRRKYCHLWPFMSLLERFKHSFALSSGKSSMMKKTWEYSVFTYSTKGRKTMLIPAAA